MFDDLHNQSLNKIKMSNVKAYPSVNSPNDGGFNSEENMRWLTKAVTTRPFIVGQTDNEVNASFAKNGQAGYGVYTAPAMFSIDGYIFKLANTPDLSFDNRSAETFMTNITRYTQRFVNDLTGQGTDHEIETDIEKFFYPEYRPSSTTDPTTYDDIKEAWQDAYDNYKCLGYVSITYTDTYYQFTVSNNELVYTDAVTGKKTSVQIIDNETEITEEHEPIDIEGIVQWFKLDHKSIPSTVEITANDSSVFTVGDWDKDNKYYKLVSGSVVVGSLTPSNLTDDNDGDIVSINWVTPQYTSFSVTYKKSPDPEPYAANVDAENNSVVIHYPVYFEDVRYWRTPGNKYQTVQEIRFKDIFGLTFSYSDTLKCESRSYPSTITGFMNFVDNENVVPNGICDETTTPNYIYDFEDLYEIDSENSNQKIERKSASDWADWSTQPISNSSNKTKQLIETTFDVFDVSDLISLIPTENVPFNKIQNTLKYYCLKGINQDDQLAVIVDDVSKKVPVAFMTSDGCLCPDGFVYSGILRGYKSTNNTYPIEGYVHFIKRMYLKYRTTSPIPNPTEDDIKAVTVAEMSNNWRTSLSTYYSDLLEKPMSLYLHLSYCSLLDHVAHVSDSTKFSNNKIRIKSDGCGESLKNISGTVQDEGEFFTYLPHTFTGYELSGNSWTATQMTVHNTNSDTHINDGIEYHCDVTSDNWKLSKAVLRKTIMQELNTDIFMQPTDFESKLPIYLDDPINYIRGCSLKESFLPSYDVIAYVNDISMYKIIDNNGTLELSLIETKISVNSDNIGKVKRLSIDNLLMPKNVNYPSSIVGIVGVAPSYEYLDVIEYVPYEGMTLNLKFLPKAIGKYASTSYYDSISPEIVAAICTHEMTGSTPNTYYTSMANGLSFKYTKNAWGVSIPMTLNVSKDNLDYLRSIDFEDPEFYKGAYFECKFPDQVQHDDLFIALLNVSAEPIVSAYDIETSQINYDITSYYSKRRRESYIHFNKIYGNNFESIDEEIQKVISNEISDTKSDLGKELSKINSDIDSLNSSVAANRNSISEIESDFKKCPVFFEKHIFDFQENGGGGDGPLTPDLKYWLHYYETLDANDEIVFTVHTDQPYPVTQSTLKGFYCDIKQHEVKNKTTGTYINQYNPNIDVYYYTTEYRKNLDDTDPEYGSDVTIVIKNKTNTAQTNFNVQVVVYYYE